MMNSAQQSSRGHSEQIRSTVGVVGLGLMGGAYASNMLAAGVTVFGCDTSTAAIESFVEQGGTPCGSPAALAENSDIVLIALPSVPALEAVLEAPDGLLAKLRPGTVVCEMGTFPVADKLKAATRIQEVGGQLLDSPVSGTGAQARNADLVVFASGDQDAFEIARPVFETFARDVRHVGPFGTGMKLKIVANLLVSIHNLAAAEALLLAERSGLDLDMVLDAVTAGAGTSRMLEVRGPMMVAGRYTPATMKHEVYAKDLDLIIEQARAEDVPIPLMSAATEIYRRALDEGRGEEDTASLFAVLKGMSGFRDSG